MRLRRDQKEKKRTLREWGETIRGRRGRKKLGRGKKANRMDEIKKGRREEEAREIGGTQNLRPEKRLKLSGEFREQGN